MLSILISFKCTLNLSRRVGSHLQSRVKDFLASLKNLVSVLKISILTQLKLMPKFMLLLEAAFT